MLVKIPNTEMIDDKNTQLTYWKISLTLSLIGSITAKEEFGVEIVTLRVMFLQQVIPVSLPQNKRVNELITIAKNYDIDKSILIIIIIIIIII